MSQPSKTLYMETTKIATERTVAEIQKVLSQYGAQRIMTEYDNGEVVSLSFEILVNNVELPFRLPCRWRFIYDILKSRRNKTISNRGADALADQSKRIAWRQILRWVESQLALVQTDMVKIQEVFLPYMMDVSGQTLYERLEQNKFNLLEMKD